MPENPDITLRTNPSASNTPVKNDLQKQAEDALNAPTPSNSNFATDVWLTDKDRVSLTATVKDVMLKPEEALDPPDLKTNAPDGKGLSLAVESRTEANTDRLVILSMTREGDYTPIGLQLGQMLTYNFPQLETVIPEFLQTTNVWLQSAFALWIKPLPGVSNWYSSNSRYVIGMDLAIDTGIHLPATPLPGETTSEEEQGGLVSVIRLMYSSAPFKFYEIAGINQELPAKMDGLAISRKKANTDPNFDAQQDSIILKQGPYFNVHVDSTLSSIYGALPAGSLKPDDSPNSDFIGDYTEESERIVWGKIDKTVGGGSGGGFYIQKLGFQWPDLEKSETKVTVLFNGGVSFKLAAGELKISFDELGLDIPLKDGTTAFNLRGFGLEGKFMDDVVEAGAAFIIYDHDGSDSDKPYVGYGKLKLQLDKLAANIANKIGNKFELDLLGTIVPKYKGSGSTAIVLFGFLGLDTKAKFGPFTLQGVALGFGVNFLFVPPSVEKVPSVPFVHMALAGVQPWGSQNYGDVVADLMAAIPDYLHPADNEYFGCFGLKFMLYGTVDCLALAVLEGGSADSFCMTIMGLMDAKFPHPAEGETNVFPIAEFAATILMVLDVGKGVFQLQTQISPSSYLFDGACRLTGGLALYTWFGNSQYAGDWVFTIGGYHSQFQVPAHYPHVPRLGFNWYMLSGYVTIKGEAYFAICAHALMFGGRLEIRGRFGPARAWLTTALDAIVCWKPLHYDVSMHVSIGVGLGPIEASLGAQLHLWGPAFGGSAEIKIKIIFVTIKIHVKFGASTNQGIPAISWNSFKTSFLPQAQQICTLKISSGLAKAIDNAANIIDPEAPDADTLPIFLINAKEFECIAQTAVPINALSWNDSPASLQHTQLQPNLNAAVAPVGVKSNNLDSTLTVNTYKKSTDSSCQAGYKWEDTINDFTWALTLEPSSPAALWAEPDFADRGKMLLNPPQVNGTRFVNDLIGGVRVFLAKQPDPGETQDIQTSLLLHNYYPLDSAFDWTNIPAFNPSTQPDAAREQQIEQTIQTNSGRNEILTILGFNLQDITVQPQTVAQFLEVPQVSA